MSQTRLEMLQAVADAARDVKKHLVAMTAKEMGTHDPDLPAAEASGHDAAVALVALLRALTALDGPIAHEQPVLADMERQIEEAAT